ncbi:MAG TPA: HAMP domain-containing sensor histidine kinase [Gemmatimonadaceae bacterium]|nr:HAMP domain-containing sensor histidine kinase [Gemmatimonadaceae bacterium]
MTGISQPPASTRIGLFTLLLGVLTLALFASLFVADRALHNAGEAALRLDAHGAALVVERELRLKAEALTETFGPLLSPSRASRDTTVMPAGFDAVWVLDTTGNVVWRQSLGAGPRVDTATVAAAGREVGPGWPHVRAVPRGAESAAAGGLLLTVPLSHRGAKLGAAVGFVDGVRVLDVLRDSVVPREWVGLVSSGRSVASAGDDRRASHAMANVPIAGDVIQVEIAHPQTGRGLRLALGMLGIVALGALLGGLTRERRQAIALAGRTTELERLYQEVARSNRMKSEFLANVSHELRTPLNAIVGFVEMLREGVYGELTPRQALPVDRIAASATHLRHLVDRLLDIAKIAAGRLEVHPEPLVLRPFVLNVASEMESLVSERGLSLSIGVGPSLPRIRTDHTHLRQILINLIGNAVKYTTSGGVSVRATMLGNGATSPPHASPATPAIPASSGSADSADLNIGGPPDPQRVWVALQVSDTGVGIAPADLQRIFDEFEQVNAGARTDSVRRGTGLGLAISRRLARLIGGDLTVVSEPGRGSVFTVWLPVEKAEEPGG